MRIQTLLVLALLASTSSLARDDQQARETNQEAPTEVQSGAMMRMGMDAKDGNSPAEAQFQALKQQLDAQNAEIEQLKTALQALAEKEDFDKTNTNARFVEAASQLYHHYHTIDGKHTSNFVPAG